jgi:GNAT superfamily N-acetyltransferase
MPDDIRIEPATLDDLPLLVDLLDDLFSMEADFVPDREKQERGLRLILENPARGRIFVLRTDHQLIAMVNLLITISTAEGGFVLLLEDVVVHRDHRGQGYGSRLLQYAVDFARQKKFLRITLLTDRDNAAAKRFYLSRGFVESDMVPLRMLLRD